ncbi:MAG: glutathione binding-like protein [Hyphomicrobiaceae bacterium]
MRYIDSVLSNQPYLAGAEFSMADITAFAGLGYADFIKLDVPSECQATIVWRDCAARRSSITG